MLIETSEEDIEKNYIVIERGNGDKYIVLRSDWKDLDTADPGVHRIGSIDGFYVRAVKMADGTIYLPNYLYNDEGERREPIIAKAGAR